MIDHAKVSSTLASLASAAVLALLLGCGDDDVNIPIMVPATQAPTPATSVTPVDGTSTPTSTVTPLDCLPSGADCLLPSDCCSGRCSSLGGVEIVCE